MELGLLSTPKSAIADSPPPAGDRLRCVLCDTRASLFTSDSVGQIAGHFVECSRLPTYFRHRGDSAPHIESSGPDSCVPRLRGMDGDSRHMAANGRRPRGLLYAARAGCPCNREGDRGDCFTQRVGVAEVYPGCATAWALAR